MNQYYNGYYPYNYDYSSSYNPYYSYGYPASKPSGGLGSLFSKNRNGGMQQFGKNKVNFSGFLNNAQKTLGVINQAIPIFYQVRPIWQNAKTMFRVAGALTAVDAAAVGDEIVQNEKKEVTSSGDGQPTFFL